MAQTIKSPRRDTRLGQTLILVCLCVLAMLGVMGLVLDGGRIYFEKRRKQAAADSGAMAAAQELRRGNREQSWYVARAEDDTELNGYSTSDSNISVAVPPNSGGFTADTNFAEVVISRNVPTTFMRVVGANSATVAARAVAGLKPDQTFCLYALDLDADGGFKNNGSGEFEANCGIMVNSSDPDTAFRGDGGACTKATVIAVTGGASYGCTDPNKQTTPDEGVPAVPDPLAHLPEVDFSAMSAGTVTGPRSAQIYSPGVFSAPIKIQSAENATFSPGIYVLQNGLQFSGGTVTGAGVMFYNYNPSGNKNIQISASAQVTLSAPTSGTYKGILFFGSRNSPYTAPNHNIARGSSSQGYTGTFYFPNEHIDFAGTPASTIGWTIVVGRTVNFSGDMSASVFNPPPPDQNPLLVPVLVE